MEKNIVPTIIVVGLVGVGGYFLYKYIKEKKEEEEEPKPPVPPIPPEPKYPKEISRTGVTILAYNVEEEKQIKEFLGIDPPGVDIDTFILAMNLASLIQWRNYWNGVWAYLKRNDLIQLTNAFYEAAHAQLYKPEPTPPPEEGRSELIDWALLT